MLGTSKSEASSGI